MNDTTERPEGPTRTVHLCQPSTGDGHAPLMVLDRPGSTRPTHIAIFDVPASIADEEVILRVSGLCIWPWPTNPIPWERVAGLAQGSILRGLP